MTGLPRFLIVGLAACLAQPSEAQVPKPVLGVPGKPKPAAPAAADPIFDASRAVFEALPEADRIAIQVALVWTGDYNAVTAGTFGRRTHDGILAWQRRSGADPTGILSPPQRRSLSADGDAARARAGFKVHSDKASGVTIGVPERLLSKRSPVPGGSRWQSTDGRVTLDTKSFGPGETDLDTLFERAIAAGPDRKITYKVKRPDFIVVTGETPTGRSFLRYASAEAGIRGFTIGYAKPVTGEMDRLVIAIANSFVPFPATAEAPHQPAASAKPAVTPVAIAPPSAPRATGLVIAPGRVLTSAAALEGCSAPRIGTNPARIVARDASGALALLETVARPSLTSPAAMPVPRTQPMGQDEPVIVLGAEVKGAPSVAPGIAVSGGVIAPLQPGAGGAPILDRAGRLAGLVTRFPEQPRLIAGVMPPTRYDLIPAATIVAFASEKSIAPGSARSDQGQAATGVSRTETLGAAAAPHLSAIVAVACGG